MTPVPPPASQTPPLSRHPAAFPRRYEFRAHVRPGPPSFLSALPGPSKLSPLCLPLPSCLFSRVPKPPFRWLLGPVHPTASQSPCLPGSPWPSPSVGYKGTFPRLRLGVSADPSPSPNCAAGETRHRVFRPLPSPRPPSVCLAELLSGSHESSLQISSSLTGTALSGFLLPPPPTPGPM